MSIEKLMIEILKKTEGLTIPNKFKLLKKIICITNKINKLKNISAYSFII